MKRTLNRLTALQVKTIKKLGRHADGGNLYLSIGSDDARRWVFSSPVLELLHMPAAPQWSKLTKPTALTVR